MPHDLIFKKVDVTKNQNNSHPVEVFSDLNLVVDQGSHMAVIGGSGVGKTTLLHLANRLEDPTSGQVLFGGAPLTDLKVTDHRRNVALVLQLPCLFARIIIENVCYSDTFINKKPDEKRGRKLLEFVGIEEELFDRESNTLSVGQMQRVCLARALYLNPKVLLLDETTASLDPNMATLVWKNLVKLSKEEGMTIIHVTHEFDKIRLADKVVLLADGKVAESGPPEIMLSTPVSQAGQRFLGK